MEVEGCSDQFSHLGEILNKKPNPLQRFTVMEKPKEEEEEEEEDIRKSISEKDSLIRNTSLAAPN